MNEGLFDDLDLDEDNFTDLMDSRKKDDLHD